MFSKMKAQAEAHTPKIIAVETAVVDLQYPKDAGRPDLKQEFFAHLKELITEGGGAAGFDENPRPGEMRLIMAEDFDAGLLAFGRKHNLLDSGLAGQPPRAQAQHVNERIFGVPVMVAGGSLANTFHAVVHASLDGKPLAEGHFVTAVGNDAAGSVFTDSLEGHIHCDRQGRQMECHVYPLDNDRIMIAAPGKDDPADGYIRPALFKDCPLDGRDRIMLGGFLFFTKGFHEVYDAVIGHLDGLPESERPVVVLTAAAQAVAASSDFQSKIMDLCLTTDVIVHANTGEFRRLLGMDADWRKPFEKDFSRLGGQALDDAKNAHDADKEAKKAANQAAISHAVDYIIRPLRTKTGHELRFVVTDGPRNTYVVSRDGCETFTPGRIAKSQIVNTVGAGDNFAGGFQLGDLYGLPHKLCVDLGHDFAQAVIQQPGARLDEKRQVRVTGAGLFHWFGGALSSISEGTVRDFIRESKIKRPEPKP